MIRNGQEAMITAGKKHENEVTFECPQTLPLQVHLTPEHMAPPVVLSVRLVDHEECALLRRPLGRHVTQRLHEGGCFAGQWFCQQAGRPPLRLNACTQFTSQVQAFGGCGDLDGRHCPGRHGQGIAQDEYVILLFVQDNLPRAFKLSTTNG